MGIADVSPSLWGECEEQAGMHFSGEGYVHAELIDPDGGEPLPFEDGAEGELVYTTLRREAMPVLRFRSRDRVVVNAQPCSCGRGGAARALHRPHRRPADRARRQPVPDRAARGRRRVPPARRRAGADPPRRTTGVRQDAPPRVLVELAEERRGRRRARARDPPGDPHHARGHAEVELVPYGTLPRSEYKSRLVDFSEAAAR